MKPVIKLVLAACSLMISTSFASADECKTEQSDHWKGKMHHEMGFDKIFFFKSHFILQAADKIGLSEEQTKKIKELAYNVKKSAIKQESEIKLIALDIREEMIKDEINEKAVNDLIDKKYAAESQKAKDGIAAYASLKQIVTKEQFAKLKDLKTEEMKHWMGREKTGEWNKEHGSHGEGRHQEQGSHQEQE